MRSKPANLQSAATAGPSPKRWPFPARSASRSRAPDRSKTIRSRDPEHNIGRLVKNLGIRLECAEPVGEAGWHQDLIPCIRADLEGDVRAERRGISPKIHRNVENAAPYDPYQLVLCERRALEM